MKIQNAYFIIWNSSKNNFSKIYNDIEKKMIIKNKKIIKIRKYFDLICHLYLFNNQKELGVYKATRMCDNSKYEIMILEVEFHTKEIGIKEIESIIPKDEIAIDDGEKILSDKESDYVIDLSKYHNKNKIEYIYQYIEDEKKIYQIEKTDSIEFENKSDYLDPKSLNIMLINKVKVESSELNLTKEKKHILLK